MNSACRHPYFASWDSGNHCPYIIDKEGQTVKVTETYLTEFEDREDFETELTVHLQNREYKSLIDYWKEWNESYYNAAYPRLIIRYEDILFHMQDILPQVCECAGGKLNGTPHVPQSSAKQWVQNAPATGSGLLESLKTNVSVKRRLFGMSNSDIEYTDKVLKHSPLKDVFGYTLSSGHSSEFEDPLLF